MLRIKLFYLNLFPPLSYLPLSLLSFSSFQPAVPSIPFPSIVFSFPSSFFGNYFIWNFVKAKCKKKKKPNEITLKFPPIWNIWNISLLFHVVNKIQILEFAHLKVAKKEQGWCFWRTLTHSLREKKTYRSLELAKYFDNELS